jgi:hypothetical protein
MLSTTSSSIPWKAFRARGTAGLLDTGIHSKLSEEHCPTTWKLSTMNMALLYGLAQMSCRIILLRLGTQSMVPPFLSNKDLHWCWRLDTGRQTAQNGNNSHVCQLFKKDPEFYGPVLARSGTLVSV